MKKDKIKNIESGFTPQAIKEKTLAKRVNEIRRREHV